MNILRLRRGYRNLKRYRQIISVFVKYGFSEILDRTGILTRLSFGRRISGPKSVPKGERSYAVRFRMALEELGPAFVKLGQVLSMRSFLIPKELASELAKLQDRVPPVPFEEIRGVVEEELGRKIDDCFGSFATIPMAAASIAQAHLATTKDGQKVVVKVQRPDAKSTIETDMDILMDFAQLLEKYVPEVRQYDPREIANDLAKTTRRELDFINEARNVELFARNFGSEPTVFVPEVFWDLTTSRVLTMEYVAGVKISDIERLDQEGFDRKAIAKNGARLLFKQIFEDGFFHADPHPGNIFVLPGNVIAPVDFGMMGRLDRELMDHFSYLMIAIVGKDVDSLVRSMIDLDIIDGKGDIRSLKLDILDVIDRYYGLPLSKINIRQTLDEGSEVIRRHGIKLPSNLMLLGKAMGTYEELARILDPEFDFIAEARPYVRRMISRRTSFKALYREFSGLLTDVYRVMKTLPRELELIVRDIRKGQLSFELRHHGMERLIGQADRASNRIAFSLIIGALIIGSSLIVLAGKGPNLFGYPLVGIAGFLTAGILGIWLVIAIIRSGRL